MLPDTAQMTLFIASSLVLLLLPGPAIFYIIARSVSQGRDAGLVSVLGVGIGSLVHVLAAALGLSALLASSAEVFSLVRLAGAGYLVYLGIRALQSAGAGLAATQTLAMAGRRSAFRDGIVVNLLNPKTAVFFIAFLPQFADPTRGPVGLQILLLGGIFVVLGMTTDSIYALAADRFSRRLSRSARAQRIRDRLAAAVYFGLGALTLAVESPRGT